MSRYPDVACDLWIINEWWSQRAWRLANDDQRGALLADAMDSEKAGYGIPDEYTAGRRVHVFAADDCEVWIGCFNAERVPPEYCGRAALLVDDETMASMVMDGGPYALLLEGRAVVGVYSSDR